MIRNKCGLRYVVVLNQEGRRQKRMVPLRMRVRAWGVFALVGGLAIVAIDLQKINAQTAATATSGFEVASIRPHGGEDDHQETNLLPGGRYVGTNATVRKLIRLALGVRMSRYSRPQGGLTRIGMTSTRRRSQLQNWNCRSFSGTFWHCSRTAFNFAFIVRRGSGRFIGLLCQKVE
jgi:hypothetical protein